MGVIMKSEQVARQGATCVAALAIFILLAANAVAQDASRRPTGREPLVVPRDFPSLQEAVNAAGDGDVIEILPGVYRLSEPVWITRKQLTIIGAGASGDGRTELLGPLPSRRDPIADPEAAAGVLNFIDAGGEVQHLLLRGFDAGVVGREEVGSDDGPETIKIANVAIRDTGRGILWKSTGKSKVTDSEITDVAHNGISLAPESPGGGFVGSLVKFEILGVNISDFGNAGIVYIDDPGVCDDDHTIKNVSLVGGGGPAILAVRSGVCVIDSYISIPRVAGIVAVSAAVLVHNTDIFFPLPTPDGRWGTGIIAMADITGQSVVSVTSNEIKNVERDFITNLGSHVVVIGNEMACTDGFDLQGDNFFGFQFSFDNANNPVQCSDECPAQVGLPPLSLRACIAQSASIEPPSLGSPLE